MTLFELIKITLDELYQQGIEEYGDAQALDDRVRASLSGLSKSFRNLTDPQRQPIDYRDPAVRIAYVYCYVAAHGDFIVQALKSLRGHLGGNIFQTESTRVSCIGGGPGSDIVAILKYLSEHSGEPVRSLTFYLLDKEQAWADTWTEIDESLGVELRIKTNFQPLDITRSDTWRGQKKFLKADLITLSYFVSEVCCFDYQGQLAATFQNLLGQMKSGALLLYIDNNHPTFNNFFNGFCPSTGFTDILHKHLVLTPHPSEQTAAVQDYIDKFGKSPRLKGTLTLRVLRKN